jgi:light-regulated signal transduction histidine kinase (bacteriophytochrome)
VRKDGSIVPVLVKHSAIKDASGKVVAVSKIAHDITKQKRSEEALRASHARLEAANKELETFTYSVSHDLRSPLKGVAGFAHILADEHGAEMSEDARHCVEMIRDNASQMGQLIEDLLAFSRLSQQPLAKQPVSAKSLAHDALQGLQAELDGRQIEISVGELPDAQADPHLLKQVWVNLLSNAIKFTRGRAPAVIHVGHEMREGVPVYFVRDNGTGFDMRYAGKLFTIFQRLHRQEDFEGTGVGLAIVQRIVSRHGGRAWAHSTKNQGATFYFTLEGMAEHE